MAAGRDRHDTATCARRRVSIQAMTMQSRTFRTAVFLVGLAVVAKGPLHAQPAEPDAGDTSQMGEAGDPGETGEGDKDTGAGGPPTKVVDFGEEEAFGLGEVMASEDLRPIKRESLLRKKYRGPAPGRAAGASEVSAAPRRVAAGVRAGVSMAGFAGSGAADTDASVGGAIAAMLVYRVSRRVAIQPELALDVRGALAGSTGTTSRLAYVSVPVLARFVVPVGGVELSAGLGPWLGVSLTSRAGDAEIARLDAGASAALGVSTPAGLALDVRYEHGLADVIASSPTPRGAVRHRGISWMVGYMF
jgi:hypothetical protein